MSALRLVALQGPDVANEGEEVKLRCLFDLEQDTLYSLKWFFRPLAEREEKEFFRVTPRDNNPKQLFALPQLDVDLARSSVHMVVLRRVRRSASGRFRCEISVEQTFQTLWADRTLLVQGE